MTHLRRRTVFIAWLASLASSTSATAQQPGRGLVPLATVCADDATAGSPVERTLLLGSLIIPEQTSSLLRPLRDADADSIADFLRRRFGSTKDRSCGGMWTRPSLQLWYNSSSSHQDRDGAVWQGRGATVSLTGGIRVRKGPVSLALRPLAFYSENRSFQPRPAPLAANDFRDPAWGNTIDLPYRFGAGAFGRIDPGESYVRVQWRDAALGVTTASQHWGPAHFYPFMLGTEGPGYPRMFVEARQVSVGLGVATAHWQLGLLEASPYTGLAPGERSRVASAFTASFAPRLFPALEVGGARFFHVRRTPGALSFSTATLPFSGLLKNQSRDAVVGGFNQLASAFFRLSPPGMGVETYGEFFREDHNVDLRDLAGEPDHVSAYTIGLRRTWRPVSGLSSLTLEHANARISHLARVRGQSPIYTHSSVAEGHSFRGQPIGSSAMLGGGGTVISWFQLKGERSVELAFERRAGAQNSEGGTWNGNVNGSHVLRYSQTRVARRGINGFLAEAQLGVGDLGRSSVIIGLARIQ